MLEQPLWATYINEYNPCDNSLTFKNWKEPENTHKACKREWSNLFPDVIWTHEPILSSFSFTQWGGCGGKWAEQQAHARISFIQNIVFTNGVEWEWGVTRGILFSSLDNCFYASISTCSCGLTLECGISTDLFSAWYELCVVFICVIFGVVTWIDLTWFLASRLSVTQGNDWLFDGLILMLRYDW